MKKFYNTQDQINIINKYLIITNKIKQIIKVNNLNNYKKNMIKKYKFNNNKAKEKKVI